MGKYINSIDGKPITVTSFKDKCELLEKNGAIEWRGTSTDPPTTYTDNLVCVVDNMFFAAIAWAYDVREFDAFKVFDGRPKQWYVYEHAKRDAK